MVDTPAKYWQIANAHINETRKLLKVVHNPKLHLLVQYLPKKSLHAIFFVLLETFPTQTFFWFITQSFVPTLEAKVWPYVLGRS